VRSLRARIHLSQIAREAVRTALIATGVVAVLYAVVGAVTFLIVTQRLTATVDSRLTRSLAVIASAQHFQFKVSAPAALPGRSERFGPPIVIWVVRPSGGVLASYPGIPLPAPDRTITGPETITVGGERLRVAGAPWGTGRVVVGSTMSTVESAQANLLLAELAVLPPLLLAVFLGAYAIGRRVAAPIEQARQRQVELTADASHELRTPLAVIEAETSLALTRRRSAGEYRQAFTRVEAETRRMRSLVDDMLWLARLDAGAARSAGAEPLDLGVLAGQAAERFHAVAEARGQRLEVDVSPDPIAVAAPAEWVDRLFGVLLDNACRYTPSGGRIRIAVAEDGSRVRATVEDSGPGIPEAERARIFDRFHRGTEAAGGAGLGLAIADAVVRGTGGRWDLGTSTLGGASMSVLWPRA
jgi:hypothetical protein